MAADRVGDAKRRQFRAFRRHEQLTVRMELAAALHHSEGPSEGEVRETYDDLRRLLVKRPGIPPEPEVQGAAVTGGFVAAGAPLLVVPTLHGEDSVDGTTVSILLAENPKLTKKERRRRRKLKEEAKHVTRMRELDRR